MGIYDICSKWHYHKHITLNSYHVLMPLEYIITMYRGKQPFYSSSIGKKLQLKFAYVIFFVLHMYLVCEHELSLFRWMKLKGRLPLYLVIMCSLLITVVFECVSSSVNGFI